MDPKTYELLNGIPEHADYAVEAGDLDREDISGERIAAVRQLLNSENEMERFQASKLLTSWGVHDGLIVLEEYMRRPEIIEGIYTHRLHGYDDTYRHILMAVTMYFANAAEVSGKELARRQVYDVLSKIIALANERPFEISEIYSFVHREKYSEYLPLLKQHLIAMVEHPELHRRKIKDAIGLIMEFDADFVRVLLSEKNKILENFVEK